MIEGGTMFKNVIWATDGSEASERALPIALELVRDSHGKLFVVHADEILAGRAGGFSMFADEEELRDGLRAKVAELVSTGIDAEFQVVKGVNQDPADLVAEAARKLGADVIVVGTRGHGRVTGMLLGSVTQRLMHVAPCPVLAVPARAHVPSEPEKVVAGAQ
jgi:nucleotide-binding universal stress UspA family protein